MHTIRDAAHVTVLLVDLHALHSSVAKTARTLAREDDQPECPAIDPHLVDVFLDVRDMLERSIRRCNDYVKHAHSRQGCERN